jgi:hypothetical protein
MKVNHYTSEHANERFVRFLQSRPVAITHGGAHTGFTHSVAYQMGYLAPKQENAIEGIIRKTKWECPEALPPDLVDTGKTIDLIVTPGHVPSDDVIEGLRAQLEAEGRAFGGVYIDPVHKSIAAPGKVGPLARPQSSESHHLDSGSLQANGKMQSKVVPPKIGLRSPSKMPSAVRSPIPARDRRRTSWEAAARSRDECQARHGE